MKDGLLFEEPNKFIRAVENHTTTAKTERIRCPCKACKNMRVFSDATAIRLHMLVGGFVENYMFWIYHGEKSSPPMENLLDEIIEDV
jgi:hypothetical protein